MTRLKKALVTGSQNLIARPLIAPYAIAKTGIIDPDSDYITGQVVEAAGG